MLLEISATWKLFVHENRVCVHCIGMFVLSCFLWESQISSFKKSQKPQFLRCESYDVRCSADHHNHIFWDSGNMAHSTGLMTDLPWLRGAELLIILWYHFQFSHDLFSHFLWSHFQSLSEILIFYLSMFLVLWDSILSRNIQHMFVHVPIASSYVVQSGTYRNRIDVAWNLQKGL